MKRRIWVSAFGIALLAATLLGTLWKRDYEMQVLVPSAAGLYKGAAVLIRGEVAGEITNIAIVDNKALLTASLDSRYTPLRAGSTARVSWQSLIGTRVLDVMPGPNSNAAMPSGHRIVSRVERVEPDDLLTALDPPTRAHVQRLTAGLDATLKDREHEVNATLMTGGPAVDALGEVLRGVGQDGPAIRDFATRLRALTDTLSSHDSQLRDTVHGFDELTATTANTEPALKQALGELPSTVQEATTTLDRVPRAVDKTLPLLDDLRPATDRLAHVTKNLHPILSKLRPTLGDLAPTLHSTQDLLRVTPDLLRSTHRALPPLRSAISTAQPAIAFLRPYTPELAGWLANWTTVFGSVNNGHYVRPRIIQSATSETNNPGIVPPGFQQDPAPAPGSLVGQPWVDANGDGIR